jgi:hypothetical protein
MTDQTIVSPQLINATNPADPINGRSWGESGRYSAAYVRLHECNCSAGRIPRYRRLDAIEGDSMRHYRSRVIVAAGAGALALAAVAVSAAPAMATWPYHTYYGYNNCSPSHATLDSTNTGNVVHDISPGVGYYEWSYSSGSLLRKHVSRLGEYNATWATIGYDTYESDSNWYCS